MLIGLIGLFISWWLYAVGSKRQIGLLLSALPLILLAVGIDTGDWALIGLAGGLFVSHTRLLVGRYGQRRTTRVLRRSWRRATIIYLVVILAGQLSADLTAELWLQGLAVAWLLFSVRSLSLTAFRISRYSYRPIKLSNTKLPTVTLAIPARNETHALTDALRSAVSSDYAKLEILVLDDCSQDSTPEIIKSFAHDGVRFIQGQVPSAGWVGKNNAYELLLNEASGDYVLFAGVDIRYSSESITRTITAAISRGAQFVSLMPQRRAYDPVSSALRPLRYFTELAFAEWPLMSSAWLVEREWLLKQGGFRALRREIAPEQALANAARTTGTYQFLLATPELGLTTRKRLNSLYETAVRKLYPGEGKEPVWTILVGLGYAMSAGLLIFSPYIKDPIAAALLSLGALLLWLSYILSELVLQPKFWLLSGLSLPLNLLVEAGLNLVSMIRYEFGRVDWKGRNVCIPVMRWPRSVDRSRTSNQR
ncbi:MAG TPA: glycosyltransferase [Candidatus Saccharimonadales bacterium]